MARIRSVKPEYFQHEGIYAAEEKSGLPLRIAYIALWTQADRRGLFRWKPRELKLNCLPYDPGDFSCVLDALEASGFLVRFQVEGHTYGWIPTFTKHQIFNLKERPSPMIPNVPEDIKCRYHNRADTGRAQGQHGASTAPGTLGSGPGPGPGRERKGSGSDPAEGEADASARLGDRGAASPMREGAEAEASHQAAVVRALRGSRT